MAEYSLTFVQMGASFVLDTSSVNPFSTLFSVSLTLTIISCAPTSSFVVRSEVNVLETELKVIHSGLLNTSMLGEAVSSSLTRRVIKNSSPCEILSVLSSAATTVGMAFTSFMSICTVFGPVTKSPEVVTTLSVTDVPASSSAGVNLTPFALFKVLFTTFFAPISVTLLVPLF